MLREAIGESLRAAWQHKGWTQQQLSDHSGLSLRTVQRALGGHTCSLATADRLAQALGVDGELARRLAPPAPEATAAGAP